MLGRTRADREAPLRIAILGAFPFPVPQGSQVLAAQQARALELAGASVTLFCYGSGDGRPPPDLELVRVPRFLSPSRLRAGPSLAKPLADAALAAIFTASHRSRGFDVALAHNGEAALAALAARVATRVPVVYVAHTLLGEELGAYAPARWTPRLNAVGRRIDGLLARRADGVIALCTDAARRLRETARGPVEVVPPGLFPEPSPSEEAVERACGRHGLERERFVLYAGNLDRYQDLEKLARAAGGLPDVRVVAVTHSTPVRTLAGLEQIQVANAGEARALTHGAAVAVLARRQSGGFPIKLLNYMEAARPIVAHAHVAEGLEHERSAWLLPRGAGPEALAAGIRRLLDDRELAARMGKAARAVLESRHAWPALADRTLRFAEQVVAGARRR